MLTRTRYLRDLCSYSGNPIACVVGVKDDFGHIHMGFSQCHPKDRFTKKMARKIALGRAINGTNAKPARHFYNFTEMGVIYTDEAINDLISTVKKELEGVN